MAIIFGSDKSGNANNWTSNSLNNSTSTTTTVSFTTVGGFNWTAPAGVTSVSYLVVGGGGGGGSFGGGGGAGGMLTGSLSVVPGTLYAVAVGGGGAGGAINASGTSGSNSVFASITSTGGGFGAYGSSGAVAGNGGSGGGGSREGLAAGTGIAGQGNAGGTGVTNASSYFSAGGGGGAGGIGGNGIAATGNTQGGGTGGLGLQSAISGTNTFYAGGGGGGGFGNNGGPGGSSIGGNGGGDYNTQAAGTANTGSGGGGGKNGGVGAAGGSGIIILSYSAATTTYDSMVDVPGIANVPSQQDLGGVVPGNYCTLNPLANGTNLVTDSGLLSVSNSSTESNHRTARATMGVSSGKWYWEVHVNNSSNVDIVGIVTDISSPNTYVGATANSFGWGYNTSTGSYYGAGEWVSSGTAPAHPASGVIGIALDLNEGKIWFSNNGTWLTTATGVGNPSAGTYPTATYTGSKTTTFFPAVSIYYNTGTWNFNFGQRAFKFPPPAGFKSLNTTNLPNPVIKRPKDHFDVKLWTGTGTSLQIGTTAKETSAFSTSSLEFKPEQTPYLTRTPAVTGSETTATYSFWLKRATVSSNHPFHTTKIGSAGSNATVLQFRDNNKLDITFASTADTNYGNFSTRVFTDTSSWYHVVVAVDTTQANAGNRLKVYVNGVQVTLWSTSNVPPQNATLRLSNSSLPFNIGADPRDATYFNGSISEAYFIDGQALTASSFGQFDANNNWMPQRYTGTYGTNGFYLPLSKPTNTDVMSYGAGFNGTDQWLSTANNAALNLGSSDFTAEAWVYYTGSAVRNSSVVFNKSVGGAASDSSYYFGLASNGMSLYLSTTGSSWTHGIEGYSVATTGWAHCVWQRRSNVLELYFNGKLLNTASTTGDTPTFTGTVFSSTRDLEIGRQSTSGSYFSGWISNARLVVGSAVYAGNFTPPTSALTAITNTKFLTLQNSTFIDNSTNAFSITNNSVQTPIDVSPWQRTVGYDASTNGNNLYPVNFDYSVPRSTVVTYGTPGTYTWVAPAGVTSVKALVIAGGGAGGSNGGGGGAGGMIYNAAVSVTPGSSYTVTVGRGGYTSNLGNATNSVFSSLTAIAGGNGANHGVSAAQNGGSGGGGHYGYNTPGTGTAGQGNAGGVGNNGNSGNTYYGAGGGGAGGVGYNGGDSRGGPGLLNSITGVPLYYAGGGGGNYFVTNTAYRAAGGRGGGGSGENGKSGPAAGGRPNTGGGGGATSAGLGGGPGGSGVVILSYTNAASYVGVGANSIIASDTSKDAPTEFEDSTGVSGTYPILNYANYTISNTNSGNTYNITNAGLTLTSDDSGAHKIVPATMPISSGKWYFEMILENTATNAYSSMGLIPWPIPNHDYLTNLPSSTSTTDGFSWQAGAANGLTLWTDYDSTYRYITMNPITASAIGDVMQIAVDIDNNKLWAGRNNVWYDASGGSTGNPSTGANPTATNVSRYISEYGALVPFVGAGARNMVTANFGQTGFMYTPPTGFKSINSKNLKDAGSYNLPDTFGNFVNTPDLVWIRNRTSASGGGLWNTLSGESTFLQTTNTNGPATTGTAFNTFLPNGFQLGVDSNLTNNSGNAYVSWNWNKGKTPGFDIVTFGSNGGVQQIPHNLGQAPKFMIIKGVNGVTSWVTYHDSVGPLSNIRLDSTAAINTGTDWFGNTNPTSTHFTIGANFPVNYSWVAYLWAEVPGFSKMGSWAGNSSTDGPFIHTGFRPRWILTKRYTSTGNWLVLDTLRNPFNDTTATFAVNTTDAEGVGAGGNWGFDILSNGFKIRGLNSEINTSGQSYMYVAFAESPFKYANAR